MLKRCRNLYLIKQKTEKNGKRIVYLQGKMSHYGLGEMICALEMKTIMTERTNLLVLTFTNGLEIKKKEMWAGNLMTRTIPLNLRNLT